MTASDPARLTDEQIKALIARYERTVMADSPLLYWTGRKGK